MYNSRFLAAVGIIGQLDIQVNLRDMMTDITHIMFKLLGSDSNWNSMVCPRTVHCGTNRDSGNMIVYTAPVVPGSILDFPSVMFLHVPICTASINIINAGMYQNLMNVDFFLLRSGIILNYFNNVPLIHDVELSVVDTPGFRCSKNRHRQQSDHQTERQQNC